ncbi:iron hydrogenase [Candidatus Falkowbacteria bacterium HGW-Falkowbacteria-1]|jgi:hypothetical protein|uniref:Iron hydrogenase n=1 Tax=Candidatus Falkowbacteria bacterium HGW-Falkowbacteria-1 TaxID=2013768 RepID=A0A2N2E9H8_9BACT|nr:MAG: iron hydrogenase [Candidatus Falkowbacteria bacterium HGW-Falkowbacteria-1]
MQNIKTLVIDNKKTVALFQFALLLGLVSIAPLFGKQLITGTIVNAILFTATILLGLRAGILIGIIPSLIALATGTLPLVFAPAVPFIIFGNILLVTSFYLLKNKNYWLGSVSASFIKFVFLYGTSSLLFNLILKEQIAYKLSATMGWVQLVTALSGGILSFFVFKLLNNNKD